jgi:UDP-hydrolysing UDP-N-acetyl-D-glucosamine 2-epimerase
MNKKVLLYIGSRANYSSARSLLSAFTEHKFIEVIVVLGAAALIDKYGSLEKLIESDGYKVDEKISFLVEGGKLENMAQSCGIAMSNFPSLIEKYMPDYVFVIGDRFDVLPIASTAMLMNIPLAHSMGGERSGTIDESIRHAISKMANLHFVANSDAEERLVKMGELPETVFNVGCPRIDYINETVQGFAKGNILPSEIIFKKFKGVGSEFDLIKEDFLLVSFHPVTTEYSDLRKLTKNLLLALSKSNMKVVMLWPNADAGNDLISKEIRIFREKNSPSWLYLFKNLPVEVYLQLMYLCKCLVGNSSSAVREGEFMGVKAVNIGTRQNSRLRGNNIIDCDYSEESIYDAINTQIHNQNHLDSEYLYGSGNSAIEISNILVNTNIINTQKLNSY